MRGHVLPVLQIIILPIGFSITYTWSVLLGHVEPGFPYISDTGTFPPESCVFGLLLDLYATVLAVTIYLRWQQVRTYYVADDSRALHRANNASLVLGLTAATGVLLVANFQETNVAVVHVVGAIMAFAVGCVYAWVQTYISYRTRLPGHHQCLRHFRLLLSVGVTLCCVLVGVFSGISRHKHGDKDHFHWSKSDEGFAEYVIATVAEWIIAFSTAIFFTTFSREFRHFTVAMPIEFMIVSMEVSDTPVVNGNGGTGDNESQLELNREMATTGVEFTVASGTLKE
ncbi:DNA damage-regulated autophagy modulator protein 1-like [Babylonia areolata]|uniref:DNA damage-regulated autophagy modulator protein 1-like n=1 Tax=Babylonia areolata TaxID=304850 RepID=UPI003FD455E3